MADPLTSLHGAAPAFREVLTFAGLTLVVHVDGSTTGGAFSVIEELPPLSDTPLHVHENEDEYFHAVEGEHVIRIGDREHRLAAGESAFAPRGTPHAQRRVTPGEGRVLVVISPAGLEGFFRRLAAAEARGSLDGEAREAASREYGITWL
ncbi:cupin domain-containing protein [Actinomycetospora aeridis]|uniref:Cupin domain-containing protein n=1 Tax=Actinomycetospora aeridis TaxID=3129231 RepID=A0ABU8N8K5_9PSEU